MVVVDMRVINKKEILTKVNISFFQLPCDSCRIQTCNLLIRSQMLYSVELRSRSLIASAKVRLNIYTTK